jgi:hypothetical protein
VWFLLDEGDETSDIVFGGGSGMNVDLYTGQLGAQLKMGKSYFAFGEEQLDPSLRGGLGDGIVLIFVVVTHSVTGSRW